MQDDLQDQLAVTPVRPVTVGNLAYQKLKSAIVSGAFEPGERLVESRLATRLQVSRTPLREAILTLEKESLLERQPQGGVRVPPFSVAEIRDLYEVRAALESLAARRAAERVRDKNVSAPEREALDEMHALLVARLAAAARDEASDTRPYTTNFHLLVHRLSANQKCIAILENVMDSMKRYRAFVPAHRTQSGLEEHRAILDAILAGDPREADSRMRKHIEDSAILYQRILARATNLDRRSPSR